MVILGLWHICMAEEKHADQKPYYQTELEELKANAKDKEKLESICRRITERQEKDFDDDRDGEKYFKRFLDNLGKETLMIYGRKFFWRISI